MVGHHGDRVRFPHATPGWERSAREVMTQYVRRDALTAGKDRQTLTIRFVAGVAQAAERRQIRLGTAGLAGTPICGPITRTNVQVRSLSPATLGVGTAHVGC